MQQTEQKSHLFETYKRWELTFSHAEGCTVTDKEGKEYTDLMAGISVVNLGHGDPDVIKHVEKQLHAGWHGSNFFQYEQQERAAELLTKLTGLDLVFFANSGTEANEAAIKCARKYTGRTKIQSFVQSFHGRTYGSMAATGQDAIHQGFGRMLEDFEYLPYNDVNALEKAVDENTAAIILEPVQGEGGVIPGSPAFIQKASELAKQHGALLIVDEVQTGLGRTGTMFAYEQAGVNPDIVTTAKALGNGFPVGAMIGRGYLQEAFGPGTHGSTFGGNPLAMAAVEGTLQKLMSINAPKMAAEKGRFFMNLLEEKIASLPVVKEIRGPGLMIGIELTESAAPYVLAMQKKGFLLIAAGPNTLRLLPPLTISYSDLEKAAAALKEVLEK
ncbi:acetylornithine transaminase [Marinococcus halotolerans]|uniref:acetylornithine transaminase n=1 Tax=Marinococcus halotolerans TaxID=301092 RepID=UPI0003B4636E|nr:acetylornithine transaminase [Marinococcus halotolerans]